MRLAASILSIVLGFRILGQSPLEPGPGPSAAPSPSPTPTNPPATTNAIRPPAPRTPSPVPTDAFVLRRFEFIPAFPVPPRFIAATFPREAPVESIERIGFGAGRLWLMARPAGAGDQHPGEGRLWTFQLAENRLEPVRGLLQTNRVRSIIPGTQRVWLNLDSGLASLGIEPFVLDAFGPPDGVTTPNLAGIAAMDSGLHVLGRNGVLFTESAGAGNFLRAPGNPAPVSEADAEPWTDLRASKDWLMAVSPKSVAVRHSHGSQWVTTGTDMGRSSPRMEPITLRATAGDGEGGFWLGSDAGLHFLNPETGAVENRFSVPGVTVPGGLGTAIAPGFKVTPAGLAAARARVANGLRDRMRQRARAARLSSELHTAINSVTPTSRLPGAVTALHADRSLLWIATTDGANTLRGRILLFHMPSRRWLGWFPIGSPVRAMQANDRLLWIGLDVTRAPGATPLVAVDKTPFIALPQSRWTSDPLRAEELGTRLASLPPRERALYAFFSGEPAKVPELLAPEGTIPTEADAETLFLLAFAQDAVGLDQPEKLDAYLTELRSRHPGSIYSEIASGVRPAPKVVPAVTVTPPPPSTPALPTPSAPPEKGSAVEVLKRRDLDGDGRLNTAEFKLWRGDDADLGPWDRNADGFLDVTELEALLKDSPAK